MPRTGSTLVEQILASHPDVVAGGERYDIWRIADRLPARIGTGRNYPSCVLEMEETTAQLIADEHTAYVRTLACPDRFFVDKQLSNYMNIGIISILFPGAMVVHCERNPFDTCLSIYTHDFTAISYAYNLSAIASAYRDYRLLMDHWHASLDRPVFKVQYEEMVRDPETRVKELLAFCGLVWTPDCLNFHRTVRAVTTASSSQVKRPIYPSSVGRWRNYRKHLGPVFEILGPPSG